MNSMNLSRQTGYDRSASEVLLHYESGDWDKHSRCKRVSHIQNLRNIAMNFIQTGQMVGTKLQEPEATNWFKVVEKLHFNLIVFELGTTTDMIFGYDFHFKWPSTVADALV